jgi:hypothetical protein
MRRLHVMLLAVLACALVIVPAAQAARVETKAVAQDKAAVQRYWTAERMREAIPAQKLLKGQPAGKAKKSPRAAATQIPPPYTSTPASTNGKVFFSDNGANYVCSGTAVLSGNRSTVWTAGHCVHDGGNNFHTNWTFVPAAVVSTNGGSALTDVVGGRNIAFNTPRAQQYAAHGYPAARPFDGQRLWVCNSPLIYNDTSASPPTMGIDCDMTGGSSGGGWIAGGSVVSVNSYGYRTLPNVMFGPYQGSVAQSLYTQAAGLN